MTNRMKVGRNDPCFCGSGKKFKKCCLNQVEREAMVDYDRSKAVPIALEFLDGFPEEVANAIELDYMGIFNEEETAMFFSDENPVAEMMMINIYEWLIADSHLEFNMDNDAIEVGEKVRTFDLICNRPGGPLFTAHQRQWLEAIAISPLRPFEVVSVNKGTGVELIDLLDDSREKLFVKDIAVSHGFNRGDVLACRPVYWQDHWELSGALYPYADRMEMIDVIEYLKGEIKGDGYAGQLEHSEVRDFVTSKLIDTWLEQIIAPFENPPEIIDASTQEKLVHVTDHFSVANIEETIKTLNGIDELSKSEGINEWTLHRLYEDGQTRLDFALTLNKKRLKGVSRTVKLADTNREWLVQKLGAGIRFTVRDISAPMGLIKNHHEVQGSGPAEEIPPELMTQVMAEFLQSQYKNWADEPLPILGNKTPREALKSPQTRKKVIELIKTYENGEAKMAKQQHREVVSYDFLWESLKLDRAEEVN